MKLFKLLLIGFVWVSAAVSAAPLQEEHQHAAAGPERLGEVRFPISCDASVQPMFIRAVALLDSFWYEKAEQAFNAVAEKDPSCGMAYWGAAMTHYHPLWVPPTPLDLKSGRAAVEKAKASGAGTERERDYIAAVEVFYKDYDKLDHLTRVLAYEKAMEQLHSRYPEDSEAAVFYALALLGTATALPPDKTLARQKKAGEIVEKLFALEPGHPGLAHYIIHSYDYPPLAARALGAARRYAKIAPDSPHALHMPSHIFTRLGLWEDSISSNLASARAARAADSPGDELHAMDYLMYAYLQTAQDRQARKLLDRMPPLGKPTLAIYFAGVYATPTIAARYALERRQWSEAAALSVPAGLPGGRYSWAEASVYFARGLGAARTGDQAGAGESAGKLESVRNLLAQLGEKYWADQVEIQRRSVGAWLARAEGKNDEALGLMRSAAELEDSTEKHPVTPGAIIPARELLGQMLLESNQPAQALEAFQATLRAAPRRFNALYGAARAAELTGDRAKAKNFFAMLIDMCRNGDNERAELRQARTFLDRESKHQAALQ